MTKPDIAELVNKLLSAIPEKFRKVNKDLESTFRTILQTAFSKLDLVTREEFEVQKEVLLRTREQVKQLESQIEKIEKTKTTRKTKTKRPSSKKPQDEK